MCVGRLTCQSALAQAIAGTQTPARLTPFFQGFVSDSNEISATREGVGYSRYNLQNEPTEFYLAPVKGFDPIVSERAVVRAAKMPLGANFLMA